MNKMLDHGETLPASRKPKPSAFVSAAGLVLGVGISVLGLIGKGLKGAIRLLLNTEPRKPLKAQIKNEKHVRQLINKEPASSDLVPPPDSSMI